MQANLEVLEGLARRLDISVPMDQLETEVQSRLKRLARNVKMDGFRPGKAPLSAVVRQHGAGVRQEVLGETLQSRFGEAVQAHQLRMRVIRASNEGGAGDGSGNDFQRQL